MSQCEIAKGNMAMAGNVEAVQLERKYECEQWWNCEKIYNSDSSEWMLIDEILQIWIELQGI